MPFVGILGNIHRILCCNSQMQLVQQRPRERAQNYPELSLVCVCWHCTTLYHIIPHVIQNTTRTSCKQTNYCTWNCVSSEFAPSLVKEVPREGELGKNNGQVREQNIDREHSRRWWRNMNLNQIYQRKTIIVTIHFCLFSTFRTLLVHRSILFTSIA